MFKVSHPEKALRAIRILRYGLSLLFLALALVRPETLLFLGLALLAFLMARTDYCPLIRRP
ncbi:hypothetical protein [Thermus caldifontis]|uniref:hypothetical protein n=1 Tax=Thermus caldifontis TaxID=1930763 RepID=UPI000DF160ED|nr:hypothetical protein [Thermus caldifontis]